MKRGILFALAAAVFYALSTPFSKLFLSEIPAMMNAGLLYIGAGVCMLVLKPLRRPDRRTGHAEADAQSVSEQKLTRADFPYVTAMILLDIAAPICLMLGLCSTDASAASLLNNFEIAATALLALALFGEAVSPRLWGGVVLVTLSCILLSTDGESLAGLRFTPGAALILLAAVLWGFENNCTRKLSSKDPLEIVLLKGLFSGAGSLLIGLFAGERLASWRYVPAVLCLGAVAYGFSIYLYIYAQRLLGAARTSAYYAAAPFIGAGLSLVLFRELPGVRFLAALALMAAGAYLASSDEPLFRKKRR